MKRNLVLLLALSLVLPLLFACAGDTGGKTEESEKSEMTENEQSGSGEESNLMDLVWKWPFGEEKLSSENVNTGVFEIASEIDKEYITQTVNGYTYLSTDRKSTRLNSSH